jgi:VIT1/CCC1 family predicted Fe2+/Mn2+ transporter
MASYFEIHTNGYLTTLSFSVGGIIPSIPGFFGSEEILEKERLC